MMELPEDGGVGHLYSSSPLVFHLKEFYSPCVSLQHILMTFALAVFSFLPYLSHLFLFIEIFVSARFLDITGS